VRHQPTLRIDDAPMNAFHLRVCCYTTGGYFCDGYILGSIGLVLPLIAGPMGSARSGWPARRLALVGIFLGALIFGPLTDRIGRQKILVFDLVVFVLASLAQLFADGPVLLLVLRLVLGLAMGADYAIGPALLCEFVPKRRRVTAGQPERGLDHRLCGLLRAGFAIQQLAARGLALDARQQRRPAAITLLLRLGTPESPRWLMSRGRVEEAADRAHLHRRGLRAGRGGRRRRAGALPELFTRRYRSRTIFAGTFWLCQVFPTSPSAPSCRHQPRARAGRGTAGRGALQRAARARRGGRPPGDGLLPRRRFVIVTFAVVCVALVVLGLAPSGPLALVLPTFLVLAFVISAAACLESVYPAEVFPPRSARPGSGWPPRSAGPARR